MEPRKIQDPDQDWVRKAQAGNKGAFGKLASRYYEMVYAVCYGVFHERESARDTTQEVFLKVYRDLRNFKGEAKFKTWLYRVAMNAAIDGVRRKKPQVSLDATDVSEDEEKEPVIIVDQSPGPRDEAGNREIRRKLEEAVRRLSPEHRAVLVLREWQGLSYEEIAETLKIEIGTVMSRLFYARKKMTEILQRDGVKPEA